MPETASAAMSLAEWHAEATKRFGPNPLHWRFVCPSCGHVASVRDWKDAGAEENDVAFSCVGRHLNAGGDKTFKKEGGPCNYAGGGLFRLNPVRVDSDGLIHSVFAFAPLEPV